MGERTEQMATTSTAVATTISPAEEESVEPVAVITLRANTKPSNRKKVVWTEDTIDNEHMNKKKSKCCCIYEKPHKFGESDSEDSDDECEHCFGHVERRKMKEQTATTTTTTTEVTDSPKAPAESTATVILKPTEGQQPEPPDEKPPPSDKDLPPPEKKKAVNNTPLKDSNGDA